VRQILAGSNDGSPKWLTIARNQHVLNYGAQQASVNNPDLFNTECSVMPVIAYPSDHRGETLDRVVQAAAAFAKEPSAADRPVPARRGSAGIDIALPLFTSVSPCMLFGVARERRLPAHGHLHQSGASVAQCAPTQEADRPRAVQAVVAMGAPHEGYHEGPLGHVARQPL
jgi:hypothetical protein